MAKVLRCTLFTCVGIGCLLLGARPAAAQTAPSTAVKVAEDPATATVADIVVTAERRATSVQSTPIAITALASETLDRANVETVERLVQLTPSMHYNDVIGEAFLAIRSVGGEPNTTVGGDPSVSFNVDGVYIARPTSVSSILFDVERIEVLRGPQGTLYGRNATGGAINVITKAPNFTEFGGTADVLFGNYNDRRARAAINIPLITDRVALRVSGVTDSHNGYEKNLFYPDGSDDLGDLKVQAFRAELGVRFTDQVDVTLRADTTSRGGRGPAREPAQSSERPRALRPGRRDRRHQPHARGVRPADHPVRARGRPVWIAAGVPQVRRAGPGAGHLQPGGHRRVSRLRAPGQGAAAVQAAAGGRACPVGGDHDGRRRPAPARRIRRRVA